MYSSSFERGFEYGKVQAGWRFLAGAGARHPAGGGGSSDLCAAWWSFFSPVFVLSLLALLLEGP